MVVAAGAGAGDGAGDKLDTLILDQQMALVAVEECGSDMAAACAALWGKGLAVCWESGGSTRRCYASVENTNARLDTGMKPLLIFEHHQSPSGGVRGRRRGRG